eukprot:gene12119-biopygen12459
MAECGRLWLNVAEMAVWSPRKWPNGHLQKKKTNPPLPAARPGRAEGPEFILSVRLAETVEVRQYKKGTSQILHFDRGITYNTRPGRSPGGTADTTMVAFQQLSRDIPNCILSVRLAETSFPAQV